MSLTWLVKRCRYEDFCERINICENRTCGCGDSSDEEDYVECLHIVSSFKGAPLHLGKKTEKYLQEIAHTDFMLEYFKRGLLIGPMTVPMFLANKFINIDRYIEEGETETLGYVAEEMIDDRRATLLLTLIRAEYRLSDKRKAKYIRDTCIKLIKSGKSNCLYSLPYNDGCELGSAYYYADEYGYTEIAEAIRIEYSWNRRRDALFYQCI
jgi:hypothetical protein